MSREGFKKEKQSFRISGFTPDEKELITNVVGVLGFDLSYVTSLTKKRPPTDFVTAGIGASYNERNGKIKLVCGDLSRVALSNLIHEMCHAQSAVLTAIKDKSISPTASLIRRRFMRDYGSAVFTKDQARHFSVRLNRFRDQSARAGVFLNPYHAGFEREGRMDMGVEFGDFDVSIEVEAILLTLYLIDPAELARIEEKQSTILGNRPGYISATGLAEELLSHITKKTTTEIQTARDEFLCLFSTLQK